MTLHQGHHSQNLTPAISRFFRDSDKSGLELTAERRVHEVGESSNDLSLPPGRAIPLRPWLLYAFARRLPDISSVTFSVADSRDFRRSLIPLVLLARFFGTPVRIRVLASKTEEFLREIGRLGQATLKLATRIETTSVRAAQVLERWGMRTSVIHEPLDLSRIAGRTVRGVQPRILVFTSNLWRQDFVSILGAFESIKSKYPRAELVVAGPDIRAEGIVGSQLIQAGLIRQRLHSFEEYLALCGECDVYLATSPIDITPLPALAAMASGLPAVIPPLGDIRPNTMAALTRHEERARVARGRIVDAVIDLIEKPDLAATLSAYSLETAHRYAHPKAGTSADSWRLTG